MSSDLLIRPRGSGTSKYRSPLRFYERDQPYFEFTNFAEFPIQLDGKIWPTSEHYFQAQKFIGTPYEEQVRNLPRARDAFELSRRPEVSQWLRSDWEKVKQDVMYKALLAKFSQHSNLREMLVKTGNRELIEHTSRDSYWGDGGDGRGLNNLGKLLMKVRSELFTLSNAVKENEISFEKHTKKDKQFPNAIMINSLSGRRPINQNASIGCFNQSAAVGRIDPGPATPLTRATHALSGPSNTSGHRGPSNTSGHRGPSNTSDHRGPSNTSGHRGPNNTSGYIGVAKSRRLNCGDHNLRVAIAFFSCLVLLLLYLYLSSSSERDRTSRASNNL